MCATATRHPTGPCDKESNRRMDHHSSSNKPAESRNFLFSTASSNEQTLLLKRKNDTRWLERQRISSTSSPNPFSQRWSMTIRSSYTHPPQQQRWGPSWLPRRACTAMTRWPCPGHVDRAGRSVLLITGHHAAGVRARLPNHIRIMRRTPRLAPDMLRALWF